MTGVPVDANDLLFEARTPLGFRVRITVARWNLIVTGEADDVLPSQFPDGEADGADARLRHQVGSTPPEEINDGNMTAPSKRLIRAIAAYEHMKSITDDAQRVGPMTIQARHLATWRPHGASAAS